MENLKYLLLRLFLIQTEEQNILNSGGLLKSQEVLPRKFQVISWKDFVLKLLFILYLNFLLYHPWQKVKEYWL